MISNSGLGLTLALGALFFWSLTPFFFAATGRIIGPFATNLLRLSIAAPVMIAASVIAFAFAGGDTAGFPTLWGTLALALSGVLGLGLGDLFLYRSLFRVGPERSSLLMTLSPAAAAATAWWFLRETLTLPQLGGMALILGGVLAAVWRPGQSGQGTGAAGQGVPGVKTGHGFWFGASAGITAAALQAVSSVMVRQAFLAQPDLSPLFATTVRISAAAAALVLFAASPYSGRALPALYSGLRTPRVLPRLLAGTVSGPILGMTCYIAAMKFQPAGVVVTITFMTPLLVMPLGAWHYGTRIGPRTIAGAAAALAGIALLGLFPQ
jgi:DME family drug/metabolite transporter